ncbi:hypothetical protein OSB04_017045 [Centaurea solstitialis]|uniref:WRKY domain-containing protein n=1 Tax=Centaurea solstitialis TaxID=347529 RepID=A0AA38TE34_9ASTR|nr:hypothetical protein OSB04_017045 [Centaurea solstitialis]
MDEKRVIESLTQGKEFAKQLQIHLNNPNSSSSSSSHQTQQILINNILNSYNKSLSLLITTSNDQSHLHAGIGITKLESQDSDHDSKDLQDFSDNRKMSSMEKWKNEVKVRGDMEVEEGLDDGYSWSKYGQKDILGAKHPRGYYRCTHRQSKGCLATKQVQRTENDPNIFHVTYRGSHTCNPGTDIASAVPLPLSSSPQSDIHHLQQQEDRISGFPEFLLNCQTCDKPTPENIKTPSFQLPSTSNNNFTFPTLDNTFHSNISPSFIPTTSSVSAYFTMSQPQVSTVGENTSPIVAGSELNNVVLAGTSTSSHNFNVGFQFGPLEFGSDFNFEN